MARVLDTAALLMWPPEKLAGGVCAASQRAELERVDASRAMLAETVDLTWQDVPAAWITEARRVAAASGDLPRLSDVDLDVLALALGLDAVLVTDDFRLRNAFASVDGSVEAAGVKKPTKVWSWMLRCTGCGATTPVNEDAHRSKRDPVGECRTCGSPLALKRSRR